MGIRTMEELVQQIQGMTKEEVITEIQLRQIALNDGQQELNNLVEAYEFCKDTLISEDGEDVPA